MKLHASNGLEVDLLIEKEGKLDGYEIKFTKTLSKGMASSLVKVRNELNMDKACILSLQVESLPLTAAVNSLHWSQIT